MSESATTTTSEEPDRECIRCGERKAADEFHRLGSGKRRAQCRDCRAITRGSRSGERKSPRKHTRRNTPVTPEARRRYKLQSYGITEDHYDEMLAAQSGGCAMCGMPPSRRRLDIDHCHRSGRVRAILCSQCNRALGSFEALRERCEQYLAKYGDGNPLISYDSAP